MAVFLTDILTTAINTTPSYIDNAGRVKSPCAVRSVYVFQITQFLS